MEREKAGIRNMRRRRSFITGHMDISLVLKQCVVVGLSMGRWRAEQKVVPDDLALKNFDSDLIRLGTKTLISPKLQKEMHSIESSARNVIKRYSYDTPFGYVVPAAAYPVLDDLITEHEKRWNEMRDKLTNEFEKNEKHITRAYRKLAYTLAINFRREGKARGYAQEYVDRIKSAIPTKEKVRDSFYFSFHSGEVPIPKVFSAEVRKELLDEAKTKMKLETAVLREKQVREMNERRLKRYEAEKDKNVDQFLDAVSNQIRSMILDTCEAALTSITKNESVGGRTGGALKRLVRDFRMMNILNDEELEAEIKKLETVMEGDARKDEKRVKEIISDLQNTARGVVLEVTAPKRRLRGDILGDAVVDEETRNEAQRVTRSHVI